MLVFCIDLFAKMCKVNASPWCSMYLTNRQYFEIKEFVGLVQKLMSKKMGLKEANYNE